MVSLPPHLRSEPRSSAVRDHVRGVLSARRVRGLSFPSMDVVETGDIARILARLRRRLRGVSYEDLLVGYMGRGSLVDLLV